MLAARTRVFSQAEIDRKSIHHRSIFDIDGDDISASERVAAEVLVPDDSSDNVEDGVGCRKRTQDACNGNSTKAGIVITSSMLGTIFLSVLIIILDSLNYQYCDNPCPVQQVMNMSYEEEWPRRKQSEYIQNKMDEMLGTGVDIEPSGTAFFLVHVSPFHD